MSRSRPTVPVIDVADVGSDAGRERVGKEIDAACRNRGFFVVVGHGLDPDLLAALDHAARRVFALSPDQKQSIAMANGGRAWRGWFPLGGELTSGAPDGKEGLYFGANLGADDPRVQAGRMLHGPNQYPAHVPEIGPLVEAWMTDVTAVGLRLLAALGSGLGVDPDSFVDDIASDPTVLFRVFRYPPAERSNATWGVGEHTDYGLLTLLAHDGTPGLQVHDGDGWIDVPAIEGGLVCNIGDMVEAMTGGRYRSTPHRVRPPAGPGDRLSFPLFLDPSWDAEIRPLPGMESPVSTDRERWDGLDLSVLTGTYGAYLTDKVAKVFPALLDR